MSHPFSPGFYFFFKFQVSQAGLELNIQPTKTLIFLILLDLPPECWAIGFTTPNFHSAEMTLRASLYYTNTINQDTFLVSILWPFFCVDNVNIIVLPVFWRGQSYEGDTWIFKVLDRVCHHALHLHKARLGLAPLPFWPKRRKDSWSPALSWVYSVNDCWKKETFFFLASTKLPMLLWATLMKLIDSF